MPKSRNIKVAVSAARIKKLWEIDKVFLWTYGGYGDCSLAYFHGGRGRRNEIKTPPNCGKGSWSWSFIKDLKNKIPSITTKAIVISGNRQSAELVRNNPFIDKVVWTPTLYGVNDIGNKVWNKVLEKSKGYNNLDDTDIRIISKLSRNKVYLTKDNEKTLKEIISNAGKKFILLHPFASTSTRCNVPPEGFLAISEYIYNTLGIKTIVVGSDYTKESNKHGKTIKTTTIEHFPYDLEYLINLVGKINLPLASILMTKSIVTMGAWSCHTTGALSFNKPTVIYMTSGAWTYFNPITSRRFGHAGRRKCLHFVTNKVTEKIMLKTMRHIRDAAK